MLFNAPEYPRAHNPISVDWVAKFGGGLRAYAYTSENGDPFLAVARFDQHMRILPTTIVEQASHYHSKAILGDESVTYQVHYFVIVSARELLLYVDPPEVLGMCDGIVSAPWECEDKPSKNFDFLLQPDFPLLSRVQKITRYIRELVP